MLGVGIIGCGKIAQVRHLPEYEQHPDVRIAGLFDFNKERAAELAKRYNCVAYDTMEELLAAPDIDAVSVCTSNNTHAEVTLAALEAGKHVLCEKPMAVTLEECRAMVSTAADKGLQLMIDQNQRFARAHVRAAELLAAGTIGTPISFKTSFGHGGPETWSIDPGTSSWFFDPKRAAMGAMADLGVHKTDLIQFLLGAKVVKTSATLTTLDKRYANGELIGVDDNAICIYTLENGVIGTMTASWTYYGPEDNSTVIYGTKGIMRIYDDPAHSIVVDLKNGERELYVVDAIQTNDNQTKSGIIDAFVDALIGNYEVPISAASVLPAMEAVFASIRSSELHKEIVVGQE